MSKQNPEPGDPDECDRRTPLHAAVAILANRWRDLNRDIRNHGRRLHRHDDRLAAMEARLLVVENQLQNTRNDTRKRRNSPPERTTRMGTDR
ncbi:hypothetical protein [Microbispora triticiradicis]|uniref:hypothetical protein n=1 Tax=Microbispora triticiradicis TaxID=2200763 RepID=UPI001AD7BBB7|nr:hypothetical protein [Microbispora triticiradicis]MBO4273762.1 hypothetical protein [Microbispora triticiradicis]